MKDFLSSIICYFMHCIRFNFHSYLIKLMKIFLCILVQEFLLKINDRNTIIFIWRTYVLFAPKVFIYFLILILKIIHVHYTKCLIKISQTAQPDSSLGVHKHCPKNCTCTHSFPGNVRQKSITSYPLSEKNFIGNMAIYICI